MPNWETLRRALGNSLVAAESQLEGGFGACLTSGNENALPRATDNCPAVQARTSAPGLQELWTWRAHASLPTLGCQIP